MKKKKYQRGGFEQGFRAREDESLGMRTGAERTKRQSMRDRRDESYGAWGRRPNQMINRKDGGAVDATAMALEDAELMNVVAVEDAKSNLDVATDKPSYDYNKGGLGARAISDEDKRMVKLLLGESSRTISDLDRQRAEEIIELFKKKDPPKHKHRGTGPTKNAKGGTASRTISDVDTLKMIKGFLGEGSRTISNADRKRIQDILSGSESSRTISNADRKRLQEILNQNAKGGVASFARGGVERAGEEGSRLSVSMERQEDAGFSPSQADFDQQHRLAEEGIMDVGADVTIVQGHDSREQLGETDGVRGGGAAIRGKNFRGVS